VQKFLVSKIYLYIFSFLGLVLVIFGLVRLLDLGMKVYIFKQADQYAVFPSYPPDKTSAPSQLSQQDKFELQRAQEEAQKKNTTAQRQQTASTSLAMIIVGAPLFYYHWRKINKGEKNS